MNPIKTTFYFLLLCLFAFIASAQSIKNYHLLIGTYTRGKSEGIYVYKFDPKKGELIRESSIAIKNPSFLAITQDQKYVYSVQEEQDNSMVSAFRFDAKQGKLTFLNSQSSGGAHPCHISVHPNGTTVFAANYTGGTLAVFKVTEDGKLNPAAQIVAHRGSSVNKQRQEKPHIHQALISPDGKYVFTPDLGTDKVVVYPLDNDALLKIEDSVSVAVAPGGGPRHIIFGLNAKYAYLLQELSGLVTVYGFVDGKLNAIQNISIVADDFKGQIGGADIHVSPDGKFLYTSNRGDANELTIFSINKENGTLSRIARQPVLGKKPRNFAIDPTGKFLLVANEDSDNIVVFKRNSKTGLLTFTGQTIEIGNPVCLIFTPAR